MAATGGGIDGADTYEAQPRWLINTESAPAVAVYAILVAGMLSLASRGPEHASAGGGLLPFTPSPGVRASEQEQTMNGISMSASVVVSVLAVQAMAGDAVQWRASDGGNGHWYQGVVFPPATTCTWVSSRSIAISHGGDLAAFATTTEANWVYANVASNPQLWEGDFGPYVGLYQLNGAVEPNGGWVWVDGTPNTGAVAWYWNQPDDFTASCGGDQVAAYWTGGPWFPSPRNYVGDMSGSGYCCCESGVDRIPSLLIEWSADCNHDGIVDYGQIISGQIADANSNGIPDVCEAPTCRDADLYPNGRIDGADLGILLSEWGEVNASTHSDINDDGRVDGADLGFLLANWGSCPQ
jgi:hypothetical protein